MSTAPLRHAIVHSPLLFLDDCGALPRSVAVTTHPRPGRPAGRNVVGGARGEGASERVVGKISVGRGAKGSEGLPIYVAYTHATRTQTVAPIIEKPPSPPPLSTQPRRCPRRYPPRCPRYRCDEHLAFHCVSCPASKHINISNSFPRRRGFIWFGHRTCPPTPTVESRVGRGPGWAVLAVHIQAVAPHFRCTQFNLISIQN